MSTDTIDIGFWPEMPGLLPTAEERKYLPEKCKLMDQDIAEAKIILDKALAEATDKLWRVLNPEEYVRVVTYLNTPERIEGYRGFARCRVCGKNTNGSQDWFKGPFRYPQGYLHYLVEHGFKPPQTVIDQAMQGCV